MPMFTPEERIVIEHRRQGRILCSEAMQSFRPDWQQGYDNTDMGSWWYIELPDMVADYAASHTRAEAVQYAVSLMRQAYTRFSLV